MASRESFSDKKKQQRITLKTALAALALAHAAPAHSQGIRTQFAQEQTLQEKQKEGQDRDLLRIKGAFERQKRSVLRMQQFYGKDDPMVKMEIHTLEETEPVLENPDYIRGILQIEKKGGALNLTVGSTAPQLAMDNAELAKRLERIPDSIVGHFRLTGDDLSENALYSYERAGVEELAQRLSADGILLSGAQLNRVLDLEPQVPEISNILIRFQKESKSNGARELLGKMQDGYFEPSALNDPEFVAGLTELSKAGIELSDLTHQPDANFKNKATQAIRDPIFVKTLIGFRAMKKPIWASDTLSIPAEVYRSPFYLDNVRIATESKVHFLDAHLKDSVMANKSLGELLTIIGRDLASDAFDAAEKYGDDSDTWKRALDYSAQHKNDAQLMELFYRLSPSRMRDSEYMSHVETYMRNPSNRATFDKYLAHFMVDQQYMLDVARIDPRRAHLNDYRAAVERHRDNPILSQILALYEGRVLRGPILRMNELHDSTAIQRLEQLKDLNAATLMEIMVLGGADAYLSTFRLLYNGNGQPGDLLQHTFLFKVKSEYGSLYEFFQRTKPEQKKFGSLLELMSQNNLVDAFLSDIGEPTQQRQILTEFLFDASKGINETQAITLDDLLHSTTNQSIQDFLFGSLRDLRSRNGDSRSRHIAELLIAEYFRGGSNVPDWARESVESYGKLFPDVRRLEGESVLRQENGIQSNVQLHFFYDDRGGGKPQQAWDGHMSFRNFIQSLGGAVTWDANGVIQKISSGRGAEITDEGDYVKIRKFDAKSKRETVIYANKPDRNDEQVAKINGDLLAQKKPQTVEHRGHSYHATKTIKLLTPDVALVNLGSCGGAKNITDVLSKSPSAQVIATKGVGTMLVNDTLIAGIDRLLLTQGRIDWGALRAELDREFAQRGGEANERWRDYQLPHQNRIAHLVAAFKNLPNE